MTPLIDRYLQNVRISLPTARRDDIVRELAEDIRAQIADREEELGRPLTEDEQETVLKHFGHPLVLATRYGPQRHVIGPALFPVYWMTLKIALGGALAVNVALAIAFLAGGSPPGRAIGHLASFPFTIAVMVFGPAASFLALAPIWQRLHLPIAVIWLASLVVLWAVLLRPDWTRVRTIGRFLSDGLSLVLATILLRAEAVVQLAPGVDPTASMIATVRFINAQARIVVLIWLLASLWQILHSIYRVLTASSTEPGGRRAT